MTFALEGWECHVNISGPSSSQIDLQPSSLIVVDLTLPVDLSISSGSSLHVSRLSSSILSPTTSFPVSPWVCNPSSSQTAMLPSPARKNLPSCNNASGPV